MASAECPKHTYQILVSLDASHLKSKQHSNLVAALLRQIAEYTDGFCAVHDADDEDLLPLRTMAFWFTSEEKRTLFAKRIELYLRADINAALTSRMV